MERSLRNVFVDGAMRKRQTNPLSSGPLVAKPGTEAIAMQSPTSQHLFSCFDDLIAAGK